MTRQSLRPIPTPVGESVTRVDGRAKVTGEAIFASDIHVPGLHHAALVRSPYPHAAIRSIDVSRALSVPGVVAVLTGPNLPAARLVFGHHIADQPMLAIGRARYAGEPVVAVVAVDRLTASEAADLVAVDYEPLPFVTDALDALAHDAPVVHDEEIPVVRHQGIGEALDRTHPNVCAGSRQAWGDVDAALAAASVVVTGRYKFPMAYAYAMETYVCTAAFAGGRLTLWSSAQHPYIVRKDVAACFGMPVSAVRLIVPPIGGGFGSKSFAKLEPLVAALAIATGRPVRLGLSVEESILTTRSDSATIDLTTAFDADGRIVARSGTIWLNTGAYAHSSPAVARAAGVRIVGPYRIPNLRIESRAIYTHTAPASSYRGFGAPQGVWASEQQIDEAAARMGIDPVELRMRNFLRPRERLFPGGRGLDADMRANIEMLTDGLDLQRTGVAVAASDAGYLPMSVAEVKVHADGSVTLSTGAAEMGQGSATVLSQIVAGELGVPIESVAVVQSDTSASPFEASTGASRTTTLAGRAVLAACDDATRQLLRCARDAYGDLPASRLRIIRGGVSIDPHETKTWGEIVRAWFGGPGGEIVGRGYIRRAGEFQLLPPFWEIGCVAAEVEVDEETGVYDVTKLTIVGDVGLAINPRLAEAQDVGGAVMALGLATREELIYVDGDLVNLGVVDYRVPRAQDVHEIVTRQAERRDGIGPYGSKGSGEGALNPTPAAIANAIARRYDVRLREAPITPERLWRALQDRRQPAARDSDPSPLSLTVHEEDDHV